MSRDDAPRPVQGYDQHYNNFRLNRVIGYVTPTDMLAGRQQQIHAERDRTLGGGAKTAADSGAFENLAEMAEMSAAPAGASRIKRYCRVTGYVAPQNKFELRLPLPSDWNQNLLLVTCGGFWDR